MDKTTNREKPFLEARNLTLNEWLDIVLNPKKSRNVQLFPNYCFPTDEHRSEYLTNIATRDQREVKSLLRVFLMPTGFLGHDYDKISDLMARDRDAALQIEQVIRVLNGGPAWEGITWVIDLLHRPRMAIDVIHAYLAAHFWWMPDWRMNGLFDAMALIRAAYLEPIRPREALLSLVPRDFELLIALLFHHRGFEVSVTRKSRDGGYDIRLQSTTAGKAESSVVECKRYTKNVGAKEVRALLGVVGRDDATRGLLVTTSGFTRPAWFEASQTNRIELIDHDTLCMLFNEHFGPEWLNMIDRIVANAQRQFEEKPLRNANLSQA